MKPGVALAGLGLAIALALPRLGLDDYYVHLLVMVGIFFLLAAGMNLLLSAGQLTLGHTAFFGIGAYTSGLLSLRYGVSTLFGMVAAGLVSALLGYLLGRITLRLRGAYFVLVTLGFAEVIRLVATNWIDLTQGPLGLPGVPPFDFGAAALTISDKRDYYYFMLVLAGTTLCLNARLLRSRFGRALAAIRQNEALAESSGISAYHHSLVAMIIACVLAGVAGSFYAHYIMFLSPELFAFYNTVTMVVMVVAGGQGTVAGPALGSLVFTFVPELLRMASFYRMLVYGVILLLSVMFMPRGIVHYLVRPVRRLKPLRVPAPAATQPFDGVPTRASDTPVLEIAGVCVRYGGLEALQDVTLALHPGEILALIGPNGAGKTTAFNVVTGFGLATAGRVSHHGSEITGLPPWEISQRGLVRMFQKSSIFPGSTVLENVLMACHRLGRAALWRILLNSASTRAEERALRERAETILAFTGLGHRAEDPAGNLPYGEQRLLGLAIALAPEPSVLLLDEPAAGLNAVETQQMMRLIGEIRRRGISVLLVEHDMKLVMGVSDRIVVLNQGQKIAEGTPSEIRRHPEVVRAYLGSGEMYAHA